MKSDSEMISGEKENARLEPTHLVYGPLLPSI